MVTQVSATVATSSDALILGVLKKSTDGTKLSTVTTSMFLKTSILASLEKNNYNPVLSTQFTYNGFEKCKKMAFRKNIFF